MAVNRVLPPLDQLSPLCQYYYNNCSNETVLNVRNPSQCWRDWFSMCAVQAPKTPPNTAILVGIIIVIAFFSLIGNSIVCIVFCLYDQLRLVKHFFVVNLAVVDNILVTVSIPLFVAFLLGGGQNSSLCRAQIVIDILCGTASIMTLAAIALERFVAVEEPLLYTTKVTAQRATVVLAFTWIYSIIVSFVPFFSLLSNPRMQCLFFGGEFVIFITVTSFVAPVGVMIFAYWRIFKIAHRHATRIMAMIPRSQNNNTSEENESRHRHVKMSRELRGAKTLTIIMCTHIICWSPLFLFYLVDAYYPGRNRKVSLVANYIILVLRYCNTLANPIIYSGINRQFRAAILKFVLRKESREGLGVTIFTNS
ncbi:predicted protein [Nematostella vectensis]|uniref:G-protein coupled receptors family 1 profile domain-containing protein n=1 Tax=Nematostella vectensis TaxID=45351 RepID=A7SUG2_NEMVE|nr:octopamine receptor [Nematostella vectensis]EDO32643.1 predicted protein [Nematostella vectensis]|eukprot:XP_001624743.1 predicted protein [Nematostella vectensis]